MPGNSLVVQWLGLCASKASCMGSIPGRGTKILHAAGCRQINKPPAKKNIVFLFSCKSVFCQFNLQATFNEPKRAEEKFFPPLPWLQNLCVPLLYV